MTEEAKQTRALVRLLAYALADKTQVCADDLLAFAYDNEAEETPQIDQEDGKDSQEVNDIYQLYPARCPNRGISTGKCSKDKKKIARLVKDKGYETVYNTTKNYVDTCIKGKCYLKNFSTFLNNFPDDEEPILVQQSVEDSYYK